MQLDRIYVKNFRNLADVDIALSSGTVVVGENRTGKSNLIEALRLVFDSSMSHADRELTKEDFWFGLSDGSEDWDPQRHRHEIEISVDISSFEDSDATVTALSQALIIENPMQARITFLWAPTAPVGEENPKYRARVYGGGRIENAISSDLRSYLHLAFLHALRDVESDIANWRRSPLRKLLTRAAEGVSKESLTEAREAITDANETLSKLEQIKDLGRSITDQTKALVGESQALETQLAIASPDPLRLLRTMRLFVDGEAARPLGSASLGTLNVLYFALLQLQLSDRLDQSEIAHVLLAVEEPEAHLHPHLQRLIFADLLKSQPQSQTTIVTTQSPHIASVANPRNLVVLRTVEGQTRAASAGSADLSSMEWDDIGRYLDATRAEIVFARRVLLVEGFAEQVLMTPLAESCGINLDKESITVCAIHGTHFSSYVQFCRALNIPWAVVTDGDPNAEGVRAGDKRAADLVQLVGGSGQPDRSGIYVGGTTFEHDLMTASDSNRSHIATALDEMVPASRLEEVRSWAQTAPDAKSLVTAIKAAGGKGRHAQRLAGCNIDAPAYVRNALNYLVSQ